MLKNFVKEGQKLPLYGIGPYLVYSMVLLDIIAIVLFGYVLKIGILEGAWIRVFRIVGILLMPLGVFIWYKGALGSDMDNNIAENKLKTTGVYAWVRNPMYSGIWFLITGISLMWHNVLILPLILIDWIIMSIVLKNTEEKWLLDLYGQEYTEYKKRVNRSIPWFPKGQ